MLPQEVLWNGQMFTEHALWGHTDPNLMETPSHSSKNDNHNSNNNNDDNNNAMHILCHRKLDHSLAKEILLPVPYPK